ncbi:MAG: acyl-CoA-binding protein [Xanthomonadales bacterium]|nr:acyl-CoA-binding protein [Xanthomonadales bacterium]
MSEKNNTVNEQFEQAQVAVKALSEKPSDEALLELYALYKQASNGDVSGDKPGFFDFVGAAKYDAWSKLEGMDQATAMQNYVNFARELGAD